MLTYIVFGFVLDKRCMVVGRDVAEFDGAHSSEHDRKNLKIVKHKFTCWFCITKTLTANRNILFDYTLYLSKRLG